MNKLLARGFIWSITDRILAQGGQLFTNLILARLLTPEDFGLIGMLAIFIAISQIIIDSGLGTGLIQKQDRTEKDFSTVFVFNLCIAFTCYTIIYFLAPFIAEYFQKQQLNILSRILGLSIVINSLGIIQKSKFYIKMDFKSIAKINSISIFLSGIFSIVMAIKGFGVWALVMFNMSISILSTSLFWLMGEWKISINFSIQSFRRLFSYGYKILISNIYSVSLAEFYSFAIGKIYSTQSLGYYYNSKKLADASSNTITSIIQQVTFPYLSSIQEDEVRFKNDYIKLIQLVAFVVFPTMTIFAILSEPLIKFLLTDKWKDSILLLQILCLAKIFTPINALNMNILNSKGRSDLYLKLDLVKLPVIIIIMAITIYKGLVSIVIGILLTSILSFFINTYFSHKLFNYGAISQLRDMWKVIVSTIGMVITSLLTRDIFEIPVLDILFTFLIGMSSYILFCYLLKVEEIQLFRKYLKSNN